MKIRSDFITNSSSSSFVIARKKDCTQVDILKLIDTKENRDMIEKMYKDMAEEMFKDFDEENTTKEILEEISTALFDGYNPMELDDWILHARYVSNEGDFIDAVIYEGLTVEDNNIFKMEAYEA